MFPNQVELLNDRVKSVRSCIPHIFARKPRTFHELAYFKATELRLIGLYIGKVIFKGLLEVIFAGRDHP